MQINLLNLIFLGLGITIVVFGSLITLFEPYLPIFIRQSFRYGKCSTKESKNFFITKLEVPKSWFRHFYVFALIWSTLWLLITLRNCVLLEQAPKSAIEFLDKISGGSGRSIEVDITSALIAILLMSLQCIRRFYETNFIQIFSSESRINLSHYFVGYIHYFGAILAIVANAEGFIEGSKPVELDVDDMPVGKIPFISLFLFAWYHQYETNMIFVHLRTTKSGKVFTEQHLLPKGGFFKYVSSPHMLFEVLMYVSLIGVIPHSTSWLYVVAWVLVNQTVNAILTHRWYISTFKDYPKQRKAIFPFIL